jgi:hypothetical protein
MKQTYSITVRGKHHTWGFHVEGEPEHAKDWEADGLEVYQVLNTIPVWVHRLGLTRPWCRAQDLWRWMRLW